MVSYKRKLQYLTDRYEKFELTILNELRQKEGVLMAGTMLLLIKNLLDEQLVDVKAGGAFADGIPVNVSIHLTAKGREFLEQRESADEHLTY